MPIALLGVVALLAVVAVGSAVLVAVRPVPWAQAVVWILVLQNAIVILLWKATGSDDFARDLLYAKEVVVAGGGVVAIAAAARAARAGRLPPLVWLVVAFGVLCAIWIPISYARHEGLEQIARGLRSLLFPVLLLAIGALLVRGRRAALALRSTLWWTALPLGASAVIERNLVPIHSWVSIGLSSYWVDVRGQSAAMLNGGLPWNFYLPLFGSVVRRAFGIMTDPLALSYYLLLPLALAMAEIWRVRSGEGRWPRLAVAAAAASAAGIAFSLSRVPIAIAVLVVLAGPAVVSWGGRARRARTFALAAGSAAAFCALVLVSAATSPRVGPADVAATAAMDQGSEGAHEASLLRATRLRPLLLGQGLGTAGYLSSRYAASGSTIGYEDPYLDAAAQVGVLGGLLLTTIVALAAVQLLRVRGAPAALALPTGVTLAALGAGGLLSGQLEVITSLGATWLFVGVAVSAAEPAAAPVEAPAPVPGGGAATRPGPVPSARSRP